MRLRRPCINHRRLEKNGYDDMSVMEVILTRGPGEYEYKRQSDFVDVDFEDASDSFDWPAHVGPANVFYSHVQLQHPNRTFECIKSGLDMHARMRTIIFNCQIRDMMRRASPDRLRLCCFEGSLPNVRK